MASSIVKAQSPSDSAGLADAAKAPNADGGIVQQLTAADATASAPGPANEAGPPVTGGGAAQQPSAAAVTGGQAAYAAPDGFYRALDPYKAFPGMVVKAERKNTWWGIKFIWRSMNHQLSGEKNYKFSTVMRRKMDLLILMYQEIYGQMPCAPQFQVQKDSPTDSISVSGFLTAKMLLLFLVYCSVKLPPRFVSSRGRKGLNLERSAAVFVDFIDAFCLKVPHKWTLRISYLGVACNCSVIRSQVDMTSVLQVAGQRFAEEWQYLATKHRWLRSTPHLPDHGCCSLGELIAVLLRLQHQEVDIWQSILPSAMQQLCRVLVHYAPYVLSDSLSNLPRVPHQQKDSLLVYEWLMSLLSSSRLNLPELPP